MRPIVQSLRVMVGVVVALVHVVLIMMKIQNMVDAFILFRKVVTEVSVGCLGRKQHAAYVIRENGGDIFATRIKALDVRVLLVVDARKRVLGT